MKNQERLDLAESRYKKLLKALAEPETKISSFNQNQIIKAFAKVRELESNIFSEQTCGQKVLKWLEL